jgi:hypothetical protein
VGLKSHHSDEIVYLKVGEGVEKGDNKYVVVGIRSLAAGSGVKLKAVQILGIVPTR